MILDLSISFCVNNKIKFLSTKIKIFFECLLKWDRANLEKSNDINIVISNKNITLLYDNISKRKKRIKEKGWGTIKV